MESIFAKLPPGFYRVVGGPMNGSEYYPPNDPIAGKPVFLKKEFDEVGEFTQYVWGKDAKAVVFTPEKHYRK